MILILVDQTRPDQTRPDQCGPDQTRVDQGTRGPETVMAEIVEKRGPGDQGTRGPGDRQL